MIRATLTGRPIFIVIPRRSETDEGIYSTSKVNS